MEKRASAFSFDGRRPFFGRDLSRWHSFSLLREVLLFMKNGITGSTLTP